MFSSENSQRYVNIIFQTYAEIPHCWHSGEAGCVIFMSFCLAYRQDLEQMDLEHTFWIGPRTQLSQGHFREQFRTCQNAILLEETVTTSQ